MVAHPDAVPPMGLRIALLGPPVVERDGGALQVDTRKAIALLAYLVISGHAQSRDTLAAMLWPDYDQTRARAALRRTLSVLNKGLDGRWLEISRDRVQLDETDVFTDVAEARRLTARVDAHAHPVREGCSTCIANLERVVALHRGEFMSGFALRDSSDFDDWQFLQAEQHRRDLGGALQRLTDMLAGAGRIPAAVEVARRWLTLDHLNEPAHRRLMRLYAQTGDRGAAMRQYRECLAVLEAELGVAPLEETTSLYEDITQNRLPQLRGVVPAPDARTPRDYPLVGREPEWRTLCDAYEAIGPDGRLLVIEGEAGIGKTRLAADLVTHLSARGAAVLAARCYEDETGLPYGPVVQALEAAVGRPLVAFVPGSLLSEAARLVPELADARVSLHRQTSGDAPGAQTRFVQGVCRVLEAACAGERPGVLWLDDLQWADEASLDVLAYLLRRLRGRPLCVLALWRTEGVQPDHRLRRLAAGAEAEGLGVVVRPGRLGPEQLAELVEHLWFDGSAEGLAARLYTETEGLPFFCVEYLAQVSDRGNAGWTLPGGVRDLVHTRLASLSETAAQALTTAAVIGRSFDVDTLLRAGGRSEEESVAALEELLAAGLIAERSGAGYDFVHEKVRAAAYERTSLARRRLLHRRVAEALHTAGRASQDAGRLAALVAHHYALAGRDADAAAHHAMAGEHARAVYANAEALDHFRAALALGHPDPARLREMIGDLHTLRGEYGDAIGAYESAAAVTKAPTDLARLEHRLGGVYLRRGDWVVADAHLRAARQSGGDDLDAVTHARVLADRSLAASHLGADHDAVELAQAALELAEATGEQRALAQAHNIVGVIERRRGRLDDARRHLERSVELASNADDSAGRTAALNNLALAEAAAGDTDRALELLRTALGVCTMQGDRHREAAIHNNVADVLRAAGRTEDAMDHLKRAVTIFAEIGEPEAMEAEIWKLVDW